MLTNEFQITFILCVITSLVLVLIVFLILITNLYQKKQLNYFLNLEQIRIAHANTLLSTKLEIQEQTIQTIAGELHDNFGQRLSLIKLNLTKTDINNYQEFADELINLVDNSINDLREISQSLNADYLLKDGLAKSLSTELSRLKRTKKYDVDLKIYGEHKFINHDVELVLFRIAQESLNNILKHANAKKIEICLSFLPSYIQLEIVDDGIGFNVNSTTVENGLGLKNISGRAAVFKGSSSIESSIGIGTKIITKIPYQNG